MSNGGLGRVTIKSAVDGLEYACAEHQDLIWLWRGDPSLRDDAMLPTHPTPEATHTVETILDYGCDWSYIVENNLDTPHLYWLHDGSIPPIESLGCNRKNIGAIGLRFFTDDCGVGHIGKTSKKVTKVVRYDAPNVVRHGGEQLKRPSSTRSSASSTHTRHTPFLTLMSLSLSLSLAKQASPASRRSSTSYPSARIARAYYSANASLRAPSSPPC